jgi:uncharacterized protein (UPF0333 family)
MSARSPGWYPNPSGAPGQLYWDGQQWTVTQPPKKRRAWPWIVGGVGVVLLLTFVVLGVVGIVIYAAIKSSHSTTNSAAPRVTATTQSVVPAGQQAVDGDLGFTVTNIAYSKTAGDPSNPPYITSTAQGVYVIITVTIRNVGNKVQSYFASNEKLIDSSGRQYSFDSTGDLWANKSPVLPMAPGGLASTKMVFDVPEGTQPTQLELHQSLLSTGVKLNLA